MVFRPRNPAFLGVSAAGGGDVSAWKELGRTSVSSGTALNVTGLANKKYLMTVNAFTHTEAAPAWHFNGVTTDSYSYRRRQENGSDVTQTAEAYLVWSNNSAFGDGQDFMVSWIHNKSSPSNQQNTKQQVGWNVAGNDTGTANEPYTSQGAAMWDCRTDGINSTTLIDEINYEVYGYPWGGSNSLNANFAATSEAIVLGYDPDDTHTEGFWEELGESELSSAGSLNTGTIANKKYLWFQAFAQMDSTSSDGDMKIRFNNTGSNDDIFSYTYEFNGGGNVTHKNYTRGYAGAQVIRKPTGGCFVNGFILNDSSKEKLYYIEGVNGDNPNTGSSTPTYRSTSGGKCTSTTNITSVQLFDNGGANYSSGSWLKVWGAN